MMQFGSWSNIWFNWFVVSVCVQPNKSCGLVLSLLGNLWGLSTSLFIIFGIYPKEGCRIAEKNGNRLRNVVYISAHLSTFSTANYKAYRKRGRIKKRMKLIKLVREKGRKISNICRKKELMKHAQLKKLSQRKSSMSKLRREANVITQKKKSGKCMLWVREA